MVLSLHVSMMRCGFRTFLRTLAELLPIIGWMLLPFKLLPSAGSILVATSTNTILIITCAGETVEKGAQPVELRIRNQISCHTLLLTLDMDATDLCLFCSRRKQFVRSHICLFSLCCVRCSLCTCAPSFFWFPRIVCLCRRVALPLALASRLVADHIEFLLVLFRSRHKMRIRLLDTSRDEATSDTSNPTKLFTNILYLVGASP